jgi:hypothetical protein
MDFDVKVYRSMRFRMLSSSVSGVGLDASSHDSVCSPFFSHFTLSRFTRKSTSLKASTALRVSALNENGKEKSKGKS